MQLPHSSGSEWRHGSGRHWRRNGTVRSDGRALRSAATKLPRLSPQRAGHRSRRREEREVEIGDEAGEDSAVEVAVSPLAGGLGDEQTGVARCSMEGDALRVGIVLSTERIGSAKGGVAQ